MIKAKSDNFTLGFLFLLGTLFLFTLLDSVAKYLVVEGYPVYQIVFARYGFHLIFMITLIIPFEGRKVFRCNSPYLVIIRSFLLVMMTLLNFWALTYISLATTSAIMLLTPIIICLLSIPILKEKIGIHRWVAIIIGFGGALIIIRPFGIDYHFAMILSLGMVVCASLFNIITRKIAGSDNPTSLQFYGGVIGLIILIPLQFKGWIIPDNNLDILLFIALGFLGWGGHQFLISAHHYAEASSLAPISYLQFLMMVLSSWILFNDIPQWPVFVGAVIVLSGGLYIWHRERIKNVSHGEIESVITKL